MGYGRRTDGYAQGSATRRPGPKCRTKDLARVHQGGGQGSRRDVDVHEVAIQRVKKHDPKMFAVVVEGVDEIEHQQGGRVAQGVAFRLRTAAFLLSCKSPFRLKALRLAAAPCFDTRILSTA
jgi:hypothetical protein